MDAKELRIGNWVQQVMSVLDVQLVGESKVKSLKGKYIQVGAASIFAMSTRNVDDLRCYPIPLTPEILEKAGFTENGADFILNDFPVYAGHHDWWYFSRKTIIGHDKKEVGGFSVRLRYLHQLQNLFYSLTGQELTIEL